MVLSDLETVCIREPTSSTRCGVGISRSKRDLPPADYLFKIESYSLSMDTKVEKYESNVFQAGGHNWKLVLYPNGNSKRKSKGHVSLYLAIIDTKQFSRGWEVNANFKLFVFDYNCNNYLTIQDADGVVRKYNEMKTEWGFDQLISLEELFGSSNGYLDEEGTCVFGAEVFVIRHSGNWETFDLSGVKPPTTSGSSTTDSGKPLTTGSSNTDDGKHQISGSSTGGGKPLTTGSSNTDDGRHQISGSSTGGGKPNKSGSSTDVGKPPMGPPVEPPTYGSFTWRLQNLLTWEDSDVVISKTFTIGDREWNLMVIAGGNSVVGISGRYLSLFLQLTDCERFPSNTTVDACFKLKILDQLHNQHYEITENSLFAASYKQRGYLEFISLSELYEVKNGYSKNDNIILEVEILKMSMIMEPLPCENFTWKLEKRLANENFTWKFENLSMSEWLIRNHSGLERHWNFQVNTKGVEAVSKTKGVGADNTVGKYLPFFLNVSETKKFQSNRTINFTLKCKILDQLSYKYYMRSENFSLLISDSQWLLSNVIPLSELNLAENGYIKDDAMIMEVEISNISMV